MKKILIAVSVFCTVLAFSCKKSNENPAANLFIVADFQGINWLAQPSTSYTPNRDTIKIQGFRATGEQNLVFKIRFNGMGNYTLKGGQASYYTTLGSDAITSNYKLDTTKTNTVTITGFNMYTNIATGKFQLNFVKTAGGSAFSNTANFTNGQFWIQLPN
jgi:hypothetical protein